MSSESANPKTLIVVADTIGTLDELVRAVGDDSCGAIATFSGTTRNNFQGKQVTELAYEAYIPMAIKQIEIAIASARSKWPQLVHVAVHHKLGIVPCGDSSVIIVASSPHRKDALHACEFLIDEVKRIAPIWKKEIYADGSSQWPMSRRVKVTSSGRYRVKHCCPLMMVLISAILGTVINKLIEKSNPAEFVLYCGNNASLNSVGYPIYNKSDPRLYGANVKDGKSYNILTYLDIDLSQQQNAFAGASPAHQFSTYLGARPQLPGLDALSAIQYGASTVPKPFLNFTTSPTSNKNGFYGLLGSLEDRLYLNASLTDFSSISFNRVPYTQPVQTTSDQDLDDSLSALINQVIAQLAALNKTALLEDDPSTEELLAFYASASQVTKIMPYGALYLDAFDPANLMARPILHFGSDLRISNAANFPTTGNRMIIMVTQLGQACLRGLLGGDFAGATVTQGIRAFPQVTDTSLVLPFGGIIGRILYPFGVSFLLPIFTIMLVKEKEERIFIMMKLNGLKGWTYYLSHYVTFYILYIFSTAVFLIVGSRSSLTFFTQTQTAVLILIFFIWGHIQIVLSFLFSTLFSRSRIALVMVFLIVLVGVIVSLVAERLFAKGGAPLAFFIWPPFAFYRALTLINTASYTKTMAPYKISTLTAGNEVRTCINFLIAEIFIYGAIASYLSYVIPSEFGKPLDWHFPITLPIARYQKMQRRKLNNGIDPLSETQLAQALAIDASETKFEDADVKEEKARVEKGEFPKGSPLILSHMRKVYPSRGGLGPKFAVKDVSFAAEAGTVFGLLGPNGAGKTTLISILTGLYPPSFGNAILAGYDIRSEPTEICQVLGICPQFDILWEDLTIEEHLYFYARLKGANSSNEREYVAKALENVSLTSLANRLTKRLSGGEKRRLSIAIALIGDPKVVFLDEPTTGLDPEVRRLIWDIVQSAKEGKTVVLTTHSMEEAEALCQRIGIMAKGTLRCIGNSLRLKELYGSGFRIYFNTNKDDMPRACTWVETFLPEGFRKIDSFATMTSYEFPSVPNIISAVFEKMESGKAQNGILDWGISQTSLEDVFVKLISDDDANAD
ncbi:hypothetical protein HDU79_005878 [Rhizoclosmatium sp. JEL0117]|nr:hypothetical protein HDU79_005878 [Rhizoclosmatium sp. JEL0117]